MKSMLFTKYYKSVAQNTYVMCLSKKFNLNFIYFFEQERPRFKSSNEFLFYGNLSMLGLLNRHYSHPLYSNPSKPLLGDSSFRYANDTIPSNNTTYIINLSIRMQIENRWDHNLTHNLKPCCINSCLDV